MVSHKNNYLLNEYSNMAKLTIKIANTGEEFEIKDVDLTQLAPRQLIDEMIVAKLLPFEVQGLFTIINKLNIPVEEDNLCCTFSELGFKDGDTIVIINKPIGGGEEIAINSTLSKNDLTYIPKPQSKMRKNIDPDSSHEERVEGGAIAGGAAIGAAAPFVVGGPVGMIIGGIIGGIGGLITNKSNECISSATFYDVYGSIFTSSEVKRRSHMLVQVYLHLYEETDKIKALAQETDKDAKRRDYIPLQCKLKKGDKVDVLLNIYGDTLLMSDKKSVVWQGSFTKCSFDYFVPKDIDVDELSCVALLSVNGVPVGEMRFLTKNVEQPRQLNPEMIAHKYNKVFISYSHQDKSKVKFLHEGLELGAVPHFFDRKYLKAGDVFPQVIQDYINSADLFILCWSENASKSEYVQKERLQALERAFPQVRPEQAAKLRIYPMSIEPHAELPGDMKNYYHFGEI